MKTCLSDVTLLSCFVLGVPAVTFFPVLRVQQSSSHSPPLELRVILAHLLRGNTHSFLHIPVPVRLHEAAALILDSEGTFTYPTRSNIECVSQGMLCYKHGDDDGFTLQKVLYSLNYCPQPPSFPP